MGHLVFEERNVSPEPSLHITSERVQTNISPRDTEGNITSYTGISTPGADH